MPIKKVVVVPIKDLANDAIVMTKTNPKNFAVKTLTNSSSVHVDSSPEFEMKLAAKR